MLKQRAILDSQLPLLPKNVKFCRQCVNSNQRPRIEFDGEGVCNACRYAEKKKTIDWGQRRKEFVELCDKHRSSDGSYDVVVPCSGGKDSSTIAYRLKHEYGMHPLSVTFAPPIYTEIGWWNLRRFIDSGYDHYLISCNGEINRQLAKCCFVYLGDHNEIFDHGQYGAPFRVALEKNIKLVMYGENAEAEYGGSSRDSDQPGRAWGDFEAAWFSAPIKEIVEFGKEDGYITTKLDDRSLDIYMLPDISDLEERGIEMHFFGYYHHWTPQENYYCATENTGFQANPEGRTTGTYSKYAQLDDLTDSFLYYMMFIKFGFGRATSDAAHEIRDGHILREEGIALVRRYDGEFPHNNFNVFLDYLDLNEEEFWEVVDRFRLPHIWDKVTNDWKLKHKVE
jgi:N-acetyl sugar amidotransferase